MTQTDLARELDLERASIGQAIDRLEELGLTERRSTKNDRRVWQVHLLPAAIELLPKMRGETDAVYDRLLADIRNEDLEHLGSIFTRMRHNLAAD